MDFHSLTRRELQALCKKNKIPANITNVAMAEALQALKIVEGTEEFMQTSQSGTAQSSMESLEMAEVTSPLVPPTAARSTRRTNIAKEAPQSVNPTTRTRRTTRKTQFKDADVTETLAMSAQTKKKGPMTSACRKMDSQFMECVDDDKKGMLVTPAATSRRKRVDESTVKSIYSTRRSSRLAEKRNVMLNEVENEESQISKKKLVAQEKNLKYGVEDFAELSGITDTYSMTAIEEKFEDKDEAEVVSVQKQETSIGKDESGDILGKKLDTSTGEEIEAIEEKYEDREEPGAVSVQKQETSIGKDESGDISGKKLDTSTGEEIEGCSDSSDVDAMTDIEENFKDKDEAEVVSVQKQETSIGKDESEDVPSKKLDTSMGEEIELGTHAEEEKFTNFENEDCGENTDMLLIVSNEVLQQSNVAQDVCNSETKNQTNTEELNSEEREASEDEAAEFVENVILECGEVDEDCPVASEDVCPSEETTVEKNIDDLIAEEGEASRVEDADSVESEDDTVVDDSRCDNAGFQNKDDEEFENEHNVVEVVQLERENAAYIIADSNFIDHSGASVQLNDDEPNEMDIHQNEETKLTDLVPSDKSYADFCEQILKSDCEKLEIEPEETNEPTKLEIHPLEGREKAADPSDESLTDFSSVACVETSHAVVLQGCPTPSKSPVSKSLMKTKSRACFSDNKENFGSGAKLIIMKDARVVKKKVDDAKDLKDLSLRKLTKMFKEKLEISKKESQNENGSEAITRPALQAISENRLVDETQN
ncbi:Unknown protein [Striga hermonthica]|uniref:Uncharacterized protein n=1 Tax=Striga hermonthica TaxID=68872 RepID=A0A9N7R8A1_STRHE|nr:Unknown protein [Striga hermonthica]